MAFTPHFYRPPEGWPQGLCLDCGMPEKDQGQHYNAPKGWQPMELAPKNATTVNLLLKTGAIVRAHWEQDLSGECCPPYQGWFKKGETYNQYVAFEPIGWRPVTQ